MTIDKHPLEVYSIVKCQNFPQEANQPLTEKLKRKVQNKNNQQNTTKQQAKRRVNILKGQLDGLLKMIEADEYCTDILDQSLAIQNSLKSLDSLILERHLRIHVADQFKDDKERAIKELLKVFRKKQRNE